MEVLAHISANIGLNRELATWGLVSKLGDIEDIFVKNDQLLTLLDTSTELLCRDDRSIAAVEWNFFFNHTKEVE